MIEYTWNIVQMDAYPQYADTTDVVFNVHWTLTGSDGTYTGYVYGSQQINLDPEATFTPYADLTLAQVVGWIQAEMGEAGVTRLQENVVGQIQNQITPPIVMPPLPWIQE